MSSSRSKRSLEDIFSVIIISVFLVALFVPQSVDALPIISIECYRGDPNTIQIRFIQGTPQRYYYHLLIDSNGREVAFRGVFGLATNGQGIGSGERIDARSLQPGIYTVQTFELLRPDERPGRLVHTSPPFNIPLTCLNLGPLGPPTPVCPPQGCDSQLAPQPPRPSITVYCNNFTFNIYERGFTRNTTFSIVDSNGNTVITSKQPMPPNSSFAFNLSAYPPGPYILYVYQYNEAGIPEQVIKRSIDSPCLNYLNMIYVPYWVLFPELEDFLEHKPNPENTTISSLPKANQNNGQTFLLNETIVSK
jgi:hypothetical protein